MSADHPNGKSAPTQLGLPFDDDAPRPRVGKKIAPRQPAVTKACEVCGKSFTSYPSLKRKFCSRDCTVRHMSLVPRKPRRGEEVACPECGVLNYCLPYQIKRGGIFCGVDCSNAYQRRNQVTKECPVCGKAYTKSQSNSGNTCSRQCRSTLRIKRPLDRMHNGRVAKLDPNGYVMVWEPDHPNQTQKGWQYEHRLVVEKAIGRHLATEEVVHHKDGNKSHNVIDNLEIMGAIDHATLSSRDYRDSVTESLARLAEYEARFGPLSDDPE